ncbi:MAG: LamG-like jellyroll fold domain-containing protein [Bacteroidota bacterium]|nr:LamG-like jellyroll fold domain-containing protein [Bacteroidota bacterium]
MKKTILAINVLILVFALMIGVSGCKKSSEKTDFGLSSLKAADTIDMNGANAPANIPRIPIIKAKFTVDINAKTVDSTKITLYRDYDATYVGLTITISGSTITITPKSDLGYGTRYELKFLAGIKSTDDQSLSPFSRTFTTIGTFVPSGLYAYYNFENNTNDQVGTHNSSFENISYLSSYSTAAGLAGSFDGKTSIVEIPNGSDFDNTHDFTLAFWVKPNSTLAKGQFVMGLGAFYGFQFEMASDYSSCKLAATYNVGDTSTTSEDLWFDGSGKTGSNGGWQGWTFCKDLTNSGGVAGLIKDKWAFIVCTYNSTTKIGTMYINGAEMKAQDFNLWPAGDAKQSVVGLKYNGTAPEEEDILALGFIKSRNSTLWNDQTWANYNSPDANHFNGLMDDVMFFHKALTATEVGLMWNSAKP